MEAQLQQLIERLDRIESKLSKMTPNDVSFKSMRNDVMCKAIHKGYKPRSETITRYNLIFDEETGKYKYMDYIGLIFACSNISC